jgi:hypothetical protein
MKFFERQLTYQFIKNTGLMDMSKIKDAHDFHLIMEAWHSSKGSPDVGQEMRIEDAWYEDKCPYYLVYPNIVPILTKLDLYSIPNQSVELPRRTLCLRMADVEGTPYEDRAIRFCCNDAMYYLRTVSITRAFGVNHDTLKLGPSIFIWLDFGECIPLDMRVIVPTPNWSKLMWDAVLGNPSGQCMVNFPVNYYHHTPLPEGKTIGETFNTLPYDITAMLGATIPRETILKALQLVFTICMIDAGDRTLIEPDILRKDEEKFDRELTDAETEKYLAKAAKRRGTIGWHVGRQYHEEHARKIPGTPYMVPPHPMHFWVGEGRKKCIFKTRRGWVTHREKIETVPTGYQVPREHDNLPPEVSTGKEGDHE